MDKPKAISLFSGAGGDTIGLVNAGFEVMAFSENWLPAIKTHEKAFPNSTHIGSLVGGDINLVPDEEFLKFRGKVDLIFAGFPCQGFSHAGKKDPNDPRNKLFWEFVRATQLIKPKWIIGENVAGLTRRKTDDGETLISEVIVQSFEEIGFNMANPKILNASEYCVPQKRKRVFFVGNSLGTDYAFPKPLLSKKDFIPIRNFMDFSLDGAVKFDPSEFGVPEHAIIENSGGDKPSGQPHPYLLSKLDDKLISYKRRVSPHHVEIADLDAPTKTIHCGYRFQPRLFTAMKNSKGTFIRPFTVKELASFQGFPPDYPFIGNYNDKIIQIGNAVPPKLVEVIAKEILESDSEISPNTKKEDKTLVSAKPTKSVQTELTC